ncbi:ABC transporter ATP-binding protein [Armatimonas sp.]|uniref:ABC transporter ATP-binding protein n=1 Tax=Armatimonas sp. TaxID=1872638 RepID=UPI00286BC9DA|nr:ABC transporter ATP-binding protein [Armatimonas sp.]
MTVLRIEEGGVGTAALEVKGLSVAYKNGMFKPTRRVVHELSFSVQPGEVVGFLGPNGAGKSTTIKAIMGFVLPEVGEATVFGLPAGTPEAKAHIGYLPEVALYYPFLTPLETLRLYGKLQGLGGKALETESLELLRRVGLEGREKQQLRTFSKGMQQRLGIAQALLGKPALLVLDEVSSGVDPIGRRHLRELLGEVRQQGTTIFFSSHELDEVAQLCDRVILIYGGRVVDEHIMDSHLRSGIGSPLETYFVETMEQAAQKAA